MKKIIYYLCILLAFIALVDMTNISTAILIVIAFLFYFLPTIIGEKKNNGLSIFVLNLFLGWTLIGWVVALVWATSKENLYLPQPIISNTDFSNLNNSIKEELTDLHELYKNEIITEEEYSLKKKQLLNI